MSLEAKHQFATEEEVVEVEVVHLGLGMARRRCGEDTWGQMAMCNLQIARWLTVGLARGTAWMWMPIAIVNVIKAQAIVLMLTPMCVCMWEGARWKERWRGGVEGWWGTGVMAMRRGSGVCGRRRVAAGGGPRLLRWMG